MAVIADQAVLPVERAPDTTRVLRLLRQVATHYARLLRTAEGAVGYLEEREISEASVERFGLGYAASGWRELGEQFASFSSEEVLATGLLVEHDGGTRFDRFRDRLIFPIRDVSGAVVGFGGRELCEPSESGCKYLNSPETCVFQKGSVLYGLYEAKEAIQARDLAVVTEGYLDVISASQAGFGAVVGTLGTACSREHIAQLFSLTNNIVFCFDGDAAGHRAAVRALQVALPFVDGDHTVSFVFLPDEHDPDSFIRAQGLGAFEAAIARATSAADFVIEQAQQGCDLAVLEDRARAAHFAGQCWSRLAKGALSDSLLRYFSALLRFRVGELQAIWENAHGAQPETPMNSSESPVDLSQALEYLQSRVGAGVEYPDAHWQAIRKYGLSIAQGDELQALYDEAHA